MHPALEHVDHRPWPLPSGPWIMEQTWHDLLFAHWPVAPEAMRPLVPPQLALDLFDGRSWIAVTPFHMSGVRARWLPHLPGLSSFPELNVRSYVTYGGKAGVYFLSLDAASRSAVWSARKTYRLPYFFAHMNGEERDGWFHYRSSREASPAELKAQYRPTQPVELRTPGTLDHWLTERYCLYTVSQGTVYRAEIHHQPWPLQDAEAEFRTNSMASAGGIQLPALPPLLHFSKKLEVLIWPLKKALSGG
jgi:hypothetical protein